MNDEASRQRGNKFPKAAVIYGYEDMKIFRFLLDHLHFKLMKV